MEYGASDREQSQVDTTMKTEEEGPDTSSLYIEIDLHHLKQEPGIGQSVKSEPTMLVKKGIAENSNEAATMEHGASRSVKEQLQTEMTLKTVTVHSDSEMELNSLTPEPGLVHSVKSEPALSVKEEILEDSSRDGSEQQCVNDSATLVITGGVNETCSTSLDELLNVKYETADIDIEPTVFQHMDVHYTINKQNVSAATEKNSIVDDSNEAMPGGRAKEESAVDKCGDNKATSQNCAHTTTEVDYDEAHMKSLRVRVERVDLQRHLLHQHWTSSFVGFKSEMTFYKPQLLSARNKLHQRNSRKAMTSKGTVADSSNQSGDKGIKTKLKPFACDICNKAYSSKSGLNLHKRSHSSVELKNHLVNYEFHTSEKHDEKFAQSGDFTKNMGAHAGEKLFQCKICHAKFANKGHLTRHMRVHTGEKPYECAACHAKFAQKGDLTRHMRVHTGEKPYKCNACHAKFTLKGNLTTHMKVHVGKKSNECDTCHTKFAERGNLTMHMRVHMCKKPYECDACHAKFTLKCNLITHMRVHTGEKPYECDACHAKFTLKGNLSTHMRVHTGEKPYECDTCYAKFAQMVNLTRHKKTHTGENPYECDTCHAKFAQKNDLTKHKIFHIAEKPYKCDTCHAKFTERGHLTKHIRVHTGEKPYGCDACLAKFSQKGDLTRHMRVHTGEKPYECDACHTKFTVKGNLTTHMRVHTGKKALPM